MRLAFINLCVKPSPYNGISCKTAHESVFIKPDNRREGT